MYAVLKDTLNITPLNAYDGPALESFEVVLNGAHRYLTACELEMPGQSNLAARTYTITLPGVRRNENTFEVLAPGAYALAIIHAVLDMPGVRKQFVTYTPTMPGVSRHQASYVTDLVGAHRFMKEVEIALVGVAQYGLGHEIMAVGRYAINQTTYTRAYRQGYRVANTDIETLELYAGYDAMPDFDDPSQPVATGDPISWTPVYPDPGNTTILHLVVRVRDRFNLLAFNQHPETIEIDENGAPALGPLSAPEFVKVLDGSTVGSVQAWARYPYEGDRHPADMWELYAEIGVDPVVGVDTPVLTEAISGVGGGLVPWRGVVNDLTPGATYHLRVAIRRSDDSAWAQSGVLQQTVAMTYEVDASDLTIFAGDEYEIQQ